MAYEKRQGKILWPVVLSGAFALAEDNGGGFATVGLSSLGLSATRIWSDFGRDLTNASGEVSLFLLLETFLNQSTNNQYAIRHVSGNGFGRNDWRIEIVRMSGSADFRISTSGTILQTLGADDNTALTDSSGVIEFPNHYDGAFMLPWYWQWHDDRSLPGFTGTSVRTNNDEVYRLRRFDEDMRSFLLRVVHGAQFMADRRFDKALAALGNVNWNDRYASFETFWEQCFEDTAKFRYVRNMDASALGDPRAGYSDLRIINDEYVSDPGSLLTPLHGQMGYEAYDISFTAKRLDTVDPLQYGIDGAAEFYSVDNRYNGAVLTDQEGFRNGTAVGVGGPAYAAALESTELDTSSFDFDGAWAIELTEGGFRFWEDWTFTIEFTFVWTAGAGTKRVIFGTGAPGFEIYLNPDDRLIFDVLNGAGAVTESLTIANTVANTTHRAVISGNAKYIYGLLDGEWGGVSIVGTTTAGASSRDLYIGYDSLGADGFTGQVDEIRFADEYLTPERAYALYRDKVYGA